MALESSVKPNLGCINSTDFQLGLFVLILIRTTSSRELWTYIRDWLTLTLHGLSHV